MGGRLNAPRAFALYLLAALCVTWPGVARLNTMLIGRMGGDNYEHVWYLWWLAQTLFERIGSPLHIPLLNHPSGVVSPLNLTHTPALFLPALLGRLITPVSAYNIAMLLAPALNALGMYWLASELTGSRRAALFGGLLFGFSPHLLGHLQAGHLSQITMLGFPLFALFLRRLLREPTRRRAAGTGLSAFLAASHPGHLAYFILPTALIMLGAARGRLRDRRLWAALLAAALIAIALLTPFYLPLLTSSATITARALELGDSVGKSIDLAAFITPPAENPLLPGGLRPFAGRVVSSADETHGYLGWVALGLALLGITTQRRAAAHWAALAGGALLLSLGPLLKFAGDLPALSIDGSAHPLQLPYALLAQLPLFRWSRTPARFGATAHFALAILAAYGLVALLAPSPRRHKATKGFPHAQSENFFVFVKKLSPRWNALLVGTLCIAAFAERLIAWPFPTAPAWQSATLQKLAATDSQRAVLNLPPSFTGNNLALYGQTLHQRPLIGGRIFRGDARDERSLEFLDALLRAPPAADVIPQPDSSARAAILASYDVGAIVNQHWAESYDAAQRDFLIAEFGAPAIASELDTLFLIPENDATPPALTFALHPADWSAPELWDAVPARWFADSARLFLYSAYAQTGRLQFTAIPSLQLHHIQIERNDVLITTVIVGDNAMHTTPTVTLPAGLSVLSFTDLDGAETVWGDLRCVGVTPLAGKLPGQLECDAHIKGTRRLSIALQSIVWQPATDRAALAQFGERIVLTAAQLPKATNASQLVVPLTFRSLAAMEADFTLFVHILGPLAPTGEHPPALLSQWDGWPLHGNFATSSWKAGEWLGLRVAVPLPADAPPGEYRVELGWYESATGTRLPVSAATRETHDNVLVLGSFVLSEK